MSEKEDAPMLFDQLKVPIMIVVAGLGSALGIGATWAATQQKVTQNSSKIEQLSNAREASALRLQAIELELKHMNKALDRIERKLDPSIGPPR